jgi:hypothetical protein
VIVSVMVFSPAVLRGPALLLAIRPGARAFWKICRSTQFGSFKRF